MSVLNSVISESILQVRYLLAGCIEDWGIGHLLAAKPPHGLTIPRKTCHCPVWLAAPVNLAATHAAISGWLVLAEIYVLDWMAHNILQFKLRSYS